MKDLGRISGLAIAVIVLLRVSIGWQFLYEGMWKYDTLDSPSPWTAEGYLKNAQGPFRDHFRSMTGDPDDLGWLDYANMSRRWYEWRDRFVKHYELDEEQQQRLNRLLDGSAQSDTAPDEFPPFDELRIGLKQLPATVNLDRYAHVVAYDADRKQLVVKQPVLPSEEAALKGMVDVARQDNGEYTQRSDASQNPDETELAFYRAIDSLINRSRRLSFRARLAAALRGDPDNVGVEGVLNERGSYTIRMGTVTADEENGDKHNVRYGKIQEYKDLLRDYEAELRNAAMDYQLDHAQKLSRKVAIMRSELVGPIRSLDSELKQAAIGLLRNEQLSQGALAPEDTKLHRASMQAMWGLLILGPLLIIGLFTRGAAVLGAVMLFTFYLVMPPWPGVPVAPGPEHSFIVNKNLIECLALLAIAALPTGSWFGIDGVIYRMWSGKKAPAAGTSDKAAT